jgi:hypothetical protein
MQTARPSNRTVPTRRPSNRTGSHAAGDRIAAGLGRVDVTVLQSGL